MTRTRPAILALGLMTALGACGSTGGDDTPASGDEPTTTAAATDDTMADETTTTAAAEASTTIAAPETGDGEASTEGAFGHYTVGDIQFGVYDVRRCIPFFDGQIDIQALAQGTQLFLVFTPEGMLFDPSVQGTALVEPFGSNAWGDWDNGGEFAFDGERATGAVTLGDSYGSGNTVEVTFDVEIPAEAIDCSL